MGEQTGIIRIRGKVGELTFSLRGDKTIVGLNTRLNGERIKSDPAFIRTRENMSEFGGTAQAAASLKNAFASVYKRFKNKNTFNRMFKVIKDILDNDTGARGERPINMTAHKLLALGFEFNDKDKLKDYFVAPYTVTANADRNQATINIPDFFTTNYLTIPEGATHFRFVAAVGTLSNYNHSNQGKGYEAVNPAQDKLEAFTETSQIPIGGMVGSATNLVVSLPSNPVLDADVTLLVGLGIEFILELGGVYYNLASGNALRIVGVY